MDKTAETSLWGWLKRGTKKIRELDMQRIENASGSHPDVEGCFEGVQFWLELKTAEAPKKLGGDVRVKFQPKQIPWAKRRWSVGGNAYVLLQVGSRRYLIPGCDLDIFEGDELYKTVSISKLEQHDRAFEKVSPSDLVRISCGLYD